MAGNVNMQKFVVFALSFCAIFSHTRQQPENEQKNNDYRKMSDFSFTKDPNLMSVKRTRHAIYPISGGYAYHTIAVVQHPLPHYPTAWPFLTNAEEISQPLSNMRGKDAGTSASCISEDNPIPEFSSRSDQPVRISAPAISQSAFHQPTLPSIQLPEMMTKQDEDQNIRPCEIRNLNDGEPATYPNYEKQMMRAKLQYHFNNLLRTAQMIEQIVHENRDKRNINFENAGAREFHNRSQNTEKVVPTLHKSEETQTPYTDGAVPFEILNLFLNDGGRGYGFG